MTGKWERERRGLESSPGCHVKDEASVHGAHALPSELLGLQNDLQEPCISGNANHHGVEISVSKKR